MKNDIDNPASAAYIFCIRLCWFSKKPRLLDRYVYELTHHLAAVEEEGSFQVGFESPSEREPLYEFQWGLLETPAPCRQKPSALVEGKPSAFCPRTYAFLWSRLC